MVEHGSPENTKVFDIEGHGARIGPDGASADATISRATSGTSPAALSVIASPLSANWSRTTPNDGVPWLSRIKACRNASVVTPYWSAIEHSMALSLAMNPPCEPAL
jgi:hypothetical protein